jgi:arylsulfatase A-like enzyme
MTTTTQSRPNILLITSDQHHYSCLGVTNPKLKTPALDRLAREGTRFDRAYTSNPVCTPARSSIITGLYPSVHGAWTIGVKLPEDVPTVGSALSLSGYGTGLIGKAHFQPLASTPESPSLESQPIMRDLDFWRGFHGPWYGFDHVEVCRNHADESHAGQHYGIWLEEQGLNNWKDYFQPWPPAAERKRRHGAWELPERLHYNTWIAERTMAFIDRAAGSNTSGDTPGAAAAGQSGHSAQTGHGEQRPFFLWASFPDPHPPYVVPEPWASMYDPADMEPGQLVPGEHDRNPPFFGLTQQEKPDFSQWREEYGSHGFQSHRHERAALQRDMAIYYGMTSFMDQQIGRILDHLDARGLAENTIVVFSTDHGHFLGQHGLIAKGAFHYEDMIRVPFLVRWPGRVPAGHVSADLQSTLDLAPTFLTAAGLRVPGLMQGYDQLPSWCGGEDQAPPLAEPVAQGVRRAPRDHVIVENRHQPNVLNVRTYVDRRYKLTVHRGGSYGELFDLEDDPDEVNNLWDAPEAAALKAQLLHRALQYEIRREPTRMPRISGA